MTDDHNDLHEDAHDEETVIAGDAVHEAPSDYEFADDHGASTIDHNDEHGSLSADAADALPARRRSLLPILAAVGGVLVLGGVAWWQFGGASSSPDASFMSAASMPAATVSSSVPASVTPAPVAPAPLAPASPPPLPVAATTAASPVLPLATPDATPPVSATALPAPVEQPTLKPIDALIAAPKPLPVVPVPAPAPVVIVKTPASVAPMLAVPSQNGDANIQSLATRMDVLQKDVEHLTTQLGQMTNALAATATPTSDISHRLDVLEQKIATLHAGNATTSSVAPSLVVTDEKPVSHPVVVKHKPRTPKTVQVKIHKPIKLAAAPKPVAKPLTVKEEKWVLRSATPDQAWVSDSNTSRDLKQVKVGDTLPTIGRVTAIRQNGDEWVVQGTKGSIQ